MNRWIIIPKDGCTSLFDCYHQQDGKVRFYPELSASALKSLAGDEAIALLLADNQYTCVELTLPKVKLSLLREALPHCVEDAIVSSVDEVHVAVAKCIVMEAPTTVCLIGRTVMRQWVDWANDHLLNVQEILPAFYILPYTEGRLSVMQYGDSVWVRSGELQGLSLPLSDAPVLLRLSSFSKEMDVYGALADEISDGFNRHAQMLRLIDCMQHAGDFPFNFMQGDFAARKRRTAKRDTLTIAVGLLVLAVIIHITYLGAASWILGSRLSTIEANNLALYQKAYPGATAVSSPRVLIARALNERGMAADNEIVDLLGVLSQAKGSDPLTIHSLHYAEHRLTVNASATDFSAIEAFEQRVKEQGYRVEQDKAQQSEQGVDVTLHVLRGRS